MKTVKFSDGLAVHGDCTSDDVVCEVMSYLGVDTKIPLIICDPPYGNVTKEKWDVTLKDDDQYADWMLSWTKQWKTFLVLGGAFYVWGGLGTPGFRPFFKYLSSAESVDFQLANVITWSKRRAYGLKHNYLYTREELAYFVNGPAKKPHKFNIPLLSTKRGYAGYNKKYPAKSEFYRRTNVWSDINEIFRGKVHPTQKPQRVIEVPIEVHTDPGDYVVDMFAGSGVTALAARKLGRKFVVIEKDKKIFDLMVKRLT